MTRPTPLSLANDLAHRRTQRKRFSASKLSSETVQTLPEYSSPPFPLSEADSDRPPDYTDAADVAGADTERGHEERGVYTPHHIVHSPPRRSPAHIRRRKRLPAALSDPFLDTLLERSVHALEISNALLRTTASAQSSLSTLLSSEHESDRFLEVRARNLSTRIRVGGGMHETWMEHLEEISEGVDNLFGEEARYNPDEEVVSRSLPSPTIPDLRHRRKPSILELDGSSNSPLRYSHPTRDALVAPAPRALTQYVESTADPQSITLPSTLGLRASGSSHSVQSEEFFHVRSQDVQSSPSTGDLPEPRPESNTPAYHLLSNLVKRSGSLPSLRSAFLSRFRDGGVGPTGKARSPNSSFSVKTSSPSPGTPVQASGSHSETPHVASIPPTLLQTIPTDDELSSSSSSSESSNLPTGYRTVQSLRKILDDHRSSSSVDTLRRRDTKFRCAPAFLPVTPPPVPIQGTSTATASISRLYTKGRHSLSTRPPSPPTHSSLKVRSVPPTPAPSPSTMSLSEAFGNGVARMIGSASSSNAPTPKRISFAELPESHSGLQPGTPRPRMRKNRGKNKQRKQGEGKGDSKEETGGWLRTLLLGGSSAGGLTGVWNRQERMEERMTRGWGSRPGYGTLDDWAV